jgi:FixJ family two-component response regulator
MGPVISIVEDVAAVRAATENLVKSLGFDVCTFSSARDFLQSHQVAETACLISDVQMPMMSGIELQTALLLPSMRRWLLAYDSPPEMDGPQVSFAERPFSPD